MASLIDLDDDIVLILLDLLDLPTIQNLRLTHPRFSYLCIKPIFTDLNRWLTEIDTQEWDSKLGSAPKHIVLAKRLTILNKPKLADAVEFLKDTMPSLIVMHPANEPDSCVWKPLHVRQRNERKLGFMFCLSPFTGAMTPIKPSIQPNTLETFEWRHALPISLDVIASILKQQQHSLRELEISQPGSARDVTHRNTFMSALDVLPALPMLHKLSICSVEESETTLRTISHALPFPDTLWVTRQILNKVKDTVTHLRIANEHIRSQMFAYDTLLDLDSILVDPDCKSFSPSFVLNLEALELGNFNIEYLLAHEISIPPNHRELVRVNIAKLRRLVLEDCAPIIDLLANLTVQANMGNVHLTEFALRHTLDDYDVPVPTGPNPGFYPYSKVLTQRLDTFLSSFTGLETLSLMMKELGACIINPYRIDYSEQAWTNHHATLKCLVSDMKTCCEPLDTIIPDEDGPFHPNSSMTDWSGATTLLSFSTRHPALSLEEIGITMDEPDTHQTSNFFMLRLFSQFPALRAIHFRNFPKPAHTDWRYPDTCEVDPTSATQVAAWANWIALPYYKSIGADGGSKYQISDECGQFDHQVARFHRRNRAQRPKDQRAPKPELKLVVVGDWGYRDQMNLSGPRLGEDGYARGCEWRDEEPFTGAWSRAACPIFYRVDWEWREEKLGRDADDLALEDQRHQRATGVEFPGWRAKVAILEQATVKGWPELPGGEVKMLDFAWQD